jgi:hypothetical protein
MDNPCLQRPAVVRLTNSEINFITFFCVYSRFVGWVWFDLLERKRKDKLSFIKNTETRKHGNPGCGGGSTVSGMCDVCVVW